MDFAALASRYDELRPAGRAWHELADETLAEIGPAARLLDVGCGTGRFAVLAAERLGARVWGVDPSAEMLAQARARGTRRVGWRRAEAERLPFKAGWFDAAHAHLVLHLLDDPEAGLRELARVLSPGGRLVIVTFRPEHFDRFHLAPYFPSLAGIDRAFDATVKRAVACASSVVSPEAIGASIRRSCAAAARMPRGDVSTVTWLSSVTTRMSRR